MSLRILCHYYLRAGGSYYFSRTHSYWRCRVITANESEMLTEVPGSVDNSSDTLELRTRL